MERLMTWRGRRCSWMSRLLRVVPGLLAMAASLLLPVISAADSISRTGRSSSASKCHLRSAKGDIQHVIYLIFDNVHLLRDNPNVPSDLEQMPNLLNFIRDNGTLLTNDHGADLAHRQRHPDRFHRSLLRPTWPVGLELVTLLQDRWDVGL